ncbi:hypothetical protein Bbelb_104660 [Branchiostoma belcheri]|nr:hypothetical protein Bbelb_104660 [Branchiostoma belcheri]
MLLCLFRVPLNVGPVSSASHPGSFWGREAVRRRQQEIRKPNSTRSSSKIRVVPREALPRKALGVKVPLEAEVKEIRYLRSWNIAKKGASGGERHHMAKVMPPSDHKERRKSQRAQIE